LPRDERLEEDVVKHAASLLLLSVLSGAASVAAAADAATDYPNRSIRYMIAAILAHIDTEVAAA
jgi:spore maturation protein SpmB